MVVMKQQATVCVLVKADLVGRIILRPCGAY